MAYGPAAKNESQKGPETRCLFRQAHLVLGMKTTILYRLKLSEIVTTIHAMGFNIETVE